MTPDEIADLRGRRYNASVVSLRKVHSDLMILRIRPDFPIPTHRAGQYTTLGMGLWEPRLPGCQDDTLKPGSEARLIRRSYSLSCSILDERGQLLECHHSDWLEFYIVLVRKSGDPAHAPGLTPRLFMLRDRDRLQVGESIAGRFTLDGVGTDDSVVLLATGTGEAPHNYMLWELLRAGHRGPIVSACCVRYRRDLGYGTVHDHLMGDFSKYTYLSLTTREAAAAVNKVYLQDLITSGCLEEHLGAALEPATTHVFLCGNPAMIGAPADDAQSGASVYPRPTGVIEILETRYGFRRDEPRKGFRGNIHYEEYW